MIALVAHCRAGFEPEAAIDLERIASAARAAVRVDAPRGRGFVVATLDDSASGSLVRTLEQSSPVFVRSMFVGIGPLRLLEVVPSKHGRRPDRASAIAALLPPLARALPPSLRSPYGDLRIEMPDTNEGKALSTLCRALAEPLSKALQDRGMFDEASQRTLHALLVDGATAYIGASAPPWRSVWPMGIARLRMPRGAPSRSTLKLAEAFATFLGADEPRLVRAGMRAVDLGAAPGGWSWQLAQRGVRVTAVDNGPLKGEIATDSLVTHVRADGFAFRPRRPVDWMVCDIADRPSRVASLVARWLANGEARRSIFNLKLPMKRRYDELRSCEALIREALVRAGVRHVLAFRQLYHDREEVTGYVGRRD